MLGAIGNAKDFVELPETTRAFMVWVAGQPAWIAPALLFVIVALLVLVALSSELRARRERAVGMKSIAEGRAALDQAITIGQGADLVLEGLELVELTYRLEVLKEQSATLAGNVQAVLVEGLGRKQMGGMGPQDVSALADRYLANAISLSRIVVGESYGDELERRHLNAPVAGEEKIPEDGGHRAHFRHSKPRAALIAEIVAGVDYTLREARQRNRQALVQHRQGMLDRRAAAAG